MNPYLSVIIPIYNESENFQKGNLSHIHEFLSGLNFDWELLLVNDGSTDDSLALAAKFAKNHINTRVINNPHRGKAATVATGVFESLGEYILFSDTDQATPIEELTKIIPKLKSGFDIVIGSRSGRKGYPLYRQILAYGMVVIRTLLLRLPFKDTQCGFKAFKKAPAIRIFRIMEKVHPSKTITQPAVNPGFDVELLYLGRKLGYKIAEVPVDWFHQDSKRVTFIKDAVNGLKELFLIRFRSLTNAYKI
jgi:glycosyltransferase involved in cell wall biosynthesis